LTLGIFERRAMPGREEEKRNTNIAAHDNDKLRKLPCKKQKW
jgi:hypothetical protein